MRLKFYWPLVLAVVLAIAITRFLVALRETPSVPPASSRVALPTVETSPATVSVVVAPEESRQPANAQPLPAPSRAPTNSAVAAMAALPKGVSSSLQRPSGGKPEAVPGDATQRPMDAAAKAELGRMVLPLVGASDEANNVWLALISDPELPTKVREDLIEDLNESGFSEDNGRRPTVDDLPLIEARMLLLEEQAQFAIDEAAAAAFAEAYKDLFNLRARLTPQQ